MVKKQASKCCKVEAVISIDERGQMVFPKELREKANIKAGDKFALVAVEQGSKFCCFSLIKVDQLGSMVTEIIDPKVEGE